MSAKLPPVEELIEEYRDLFESVALNAVCNAYRTDGDIKRANEMAVRDVKEFKKKYPRKKRDVLELGRSVIE